MPKTEQEMRVTSARLPVYVLDVADKLARERGVGFGRLVNDLIVAEATRRGLLRKAGRCVECGQKINAKGGK